jgi:hypothetical protein
MIKAIKHEPREEIPEEWTLPQPNKDTDIEDSIELLLYLIAEPSFKPPRRKS